MTKFLVIFLLCAFGSWGVQALSCYECGPTQNSCLALNDTIAEQKCDNKKCISFFVKSDNTETKGIYRNCQEKTDVKSSCDLIKETYQKGSDEVINCFECETDKCNSRVYKEDGSSDASKTQFMFGLILPLLSVLLFKLH